MDLWHLNAAMLQKQGSQQTRFILLEYRPFPLTTIFPIAVIMAGREGLLPFYFNVEGKTRKEMLCMLSEKLASVQKKIDEALALLQGKEGNRGYGDHSCCH